MKNTLWRLACAAVVLGLVVTQQVASASVWTPTGTGTYNWNDPANWDTNPSIPNGAGAVANLNLALTATPQTVKPNLSPLTVGSLTWGSLGNANVQHIGAYSGDGTITMNNNGAGALIKYNSGANNLSFFRSNVTLADNLEVNIATSRIAKFGYNTTWSGTGNIKKTGPGTMYLSADTSGLVGNMDVQAGRLQLAGDTPNTNWAQGTLKLEAGLQLIDANLIGDNVNIIMNGGWINQGADDTVGTLQVLANSESNTSGTWHFANSSGVAWTAGTQMVFNFSNDQIHAPETNHVFFGTDNTGLTAAQLSQVMWQEIDANWDPLGPLVPSQWGAGNIGEVIPAVPEPASLSLLALGGLALLRRRQRA